MKTTIFASFLIVLILSSCASGNRIYEHSDPFKQQTTLKLNQALKGFSDESRRGLFRFPDYMVIFKHYYEKLNDGNGHYILDVKLSTSVRAYDLEPAIYLSADSRLITLKADNKVTKMYQQGASSTSSETTSSTSEDPEKEGEEITETSTTYTNSSSHDTYQLMQLRFTPDIELLKEISASGKVSFRLYIDTEAIDIPLKTFKKRKFESYVNRLILL